MDIDPTHIETLRELLSMPEVRNGAIIAAALVALLGFFVTVITFVKARHDVSDENRRKRCEAALGYSLSANPPHIKSRETLARRFGPTTINSRVISADEFDEILSQSDANNEDASILVGHLQNLLNHWERMALAINRGVADEETCFEMVGQRIVNTIHQYGAYVNKVMKSNPRSYAHLVKLEAKWRGDKRLVAPSKSTRARRSLIPRFGR